MYDIKYDYEKNNIYEIRPNGSLHTLTDDFPSLPQKSPNGKKAIYISPLEWECYGSLYMYNLENGAVEVLIEPENRYIPKDAVWLDNDTVAVIIGFGDGTVAVGGNIYILNIESKNKKSLTEYPAKIQITKLEVTESKLLYKGIEYIDSNLSEFKEIKDSFTLKNITNV